MSSVSVCTIAGGRDAHLHALVEGLSAQTVPPSELVIGRLQSVPYGNLPATSFPVRQVSIVGKRMQLSRARNRAAATAGGETLVFLDVDCVPGPALVERLTEAAQAGCAMGDVRYLAQDDIAEDRCFDRLWRAGTEHPARAFSSRFGPGTHRLADATEFWSLCFAIRRDAFWEIGGFDETYEGYGGEDTDFAMALEGLQIPLQWCSQARAVHQWHPVQKPPLDHLQDIVRNANLFHAKHGRWCMDYWLDQFERDGYVARRDVLEVLRNPSVAERKAAICDGAVRFS
ncbi:galactosyltransferase-related protein [Rhizobiaceae bacterium]|nr:galactosyltransferase-related protein [Rhizobiaceae bacterium]